MAKRGQRSGEPEAGRQEALRNLRTSETARERAVNDALALHERGALAAVVPRYQALLAADSSDPRLWLNLGAAQQGLGQSQAALTAYQEARRRDPTLVEAAFNLGCILAELGRDEEAARQFGAAAALRPSFAGAHYNLGNAQRRLGNLEPAIAAYREALRLRPAHADAWNGLGLALRELGDIVEAEAAFSQALEHNPDHGAAFANLTTVHRFKPDDPLLGRARAFEQRRGALPTRARIEIAYGLGKLYDDLDEPATAMAWLAEGAGLMRAQLPYGEAEAAAEAALIAAIRAALTPEVLRRSPEGCPSTLPIFVVGMPRSGTTLVEQILASHPAVAGAGELKALGRCLEGWIAPAGVDLSAGPTARERGEAYLRALSPFLAPQVSRVVDKMPDNFRYVGLIQLILPNAVIVHCRRDPVDTCLSCYRTLFAEGNAWSYDLGTLGRRFRLYAETMAHWQAVLPGRVYDLRYETLVENPEREIRRLLDHCGLPFDAACLEFHQRRRRVSTASATQVRQPIHTGAVGRARRYRPFLEPLLEALKGADSWAFDQ